MRISQRFIGFAASVGFFLVVPETVSAAAGAQALAVFIREHIIDQALLAFWGISLLAIFYYGMRMLGDAHKDSALGDMSNSILYAMMGFAVIGSAVVFSDAFTTTGFSGTTQTTVSPSSASVFFQFDVIRQFMINLSYFIFFLMVVVSAFKMVVTRGDQAEFDKWRKVIVGACIGAMIMFIANAIVASVASGSPMAIIIEMRGIGLFLLTIVGFACAAALIIAGIMLIVSIDEGLKDRAKKIIYGTLISLVLILCCYVIIVTFVPENTFVIP